MPGFDGTGPRGQGPLTGGGMGYCAMPANQVARPLGRGLYGGRGGGGRGWRNCFYATGLPGWMRQRKMAQAFGGFERGLSKEDELAALKSEAEHLKNELDAIQARVQELEAK